MKFKIPDILLICMLFFLSSSLFINNSVFAEKIKHPQAGVSVWVPDNWKRNQKKDLMIVTNQESGLLFAFLVLEKMSLNQALRVMNIELSRFVDQIQTSGPANQIKVNGLDGVFIDGTGEIKGKPVQVGMALFYTPRGKILMLLGIIEEGRIEDNNNVVKKVLTSVTPI